MYLVVGYYTMIDTKIIERATKAFKTSARLNLPITAALAPAGALLLSGITDPGAEGGKSYR